MAYKNTPVLSIIAPAYDEEENIIPLSEAFDSLRKKVPYPIELIIVDDGSSDRTLLRAQSMAKHLPFIKVVSYGFNRGKTFAVRKGFETAKGKYIVIFDSDLQFHPEDIPPMIEKIQHGADLVAGYKVGKYQKPLVSKIYNLLGRILFRVPVRDMNAMKAMRREVLETIPFRPDWHRYIVPWAHKQGFSLTEHPVKLRPRTRGKSKYRGIGRIFIGVFDMVSVWFQLTFARRPMLFFGMAGFITFKLAFILGIIAVVLRYGYGIGFRPLLTLIAMLANMGLLLFIGGFLGEMIEGLIERTNENARRDRSSQRSFNDKRHRQDDKKPRRQTNTSERYERKRSESERPVKTTPNRKRQRKTTQERTEKMPPKNQSTKLDSKLDSQIDTTEKTVALQTSENEKTTQKSENDISWGREKRKGIKK